MSEPELSFRPAEREYRSWVLDSRRWARYRPRAGDIVIATYPKCGTTWTERIVGMLLAQSPASRAIRDYSDWIDCRFREPLDAVIARLEARRERRVLKTHLPLDALPLYDQVRYIHVARDGRDAWASFYNHRRTYSAEMLAVFDRIGREDPELAAPLPRPDPVPREDFRKWLRVGEPGAAPGDLGRMDFFGFVRSFWQERDRTNIMLVHYNDMKADLATEMRRIAAFIGIDCPAGLWPQLVEAASFESMRRDGALLMPHLGGSFTDGANSFFFAGRNGRWREMLTKDDLAAYDAKIVASLSLACARWVAVGGLVAEDPQMDLRNSAS